MLKTPGIYVPHVRTVRYDPCTATVAAVIVLVIYRPNSPSYGTNRLSNGNPCLPSTPPLRKFDGRTDISCFNITQVTAWLELG
jgi:hypothetical protein